MTTIWQTQYKVIVIMSFFRVIKWLYNEIIWIHLSSFSDSNGKWSWLQHCDGPLNDLLLSLSFVTKFKSLGDLRVVVDFRLYCEVNVSFLLWKTLWDFNVIYLGFGTMQLSWRYHNKISRWFSHKKISCIFNIMLPGDSTQR